MCEKKGWGIVIDKRSTGFIIFTWVIAITIAIVMIFITGCSSSRFVHMEAETFTGVLSGGPVSGNISAKNFRLDIAPVVVYSASDEINDVPNAFFSSGVGFYDEGPQ